MALTIQRLNFDPVTGDNPSEAFLKLDNSVAEIADYLAGGDSPAGIDARLTAVESDVDTLQGSFAGLGNSASKNVGTGAGTVAAGDDQRLLLRGKRNQLINGDLRVNQLVFAGGALAANTYGYDMWRTFGAAASMTLSADRTTITLNGTAGTVVEGPGDAGATLTVSVTNPSGPITVNIRPDATTAGVSGVIPAGAGLQSVTLTVPSAITGNVYLLLTTTAAVTFDGPAKRAGIQMETGSFATPFEFANIADVLAQCQRYYWKSFRDSLAPGNATGSLVGAIAYVIGPGQAGSGVFAGVRVQFPQRMRAVPSLTFFNPLGFSVNWINFNANANSGAVTTGPASTSELATQLINTQVGSDAQGHTICVHMTADARL